MPKVTFTGYSKFTSYKNDPNGKDYLTIGIVYKDPSWVGSRAQQKFIPVAFYNQIADFKPYSTILLDEMDGRVIDISLVSEPK